MLANRHRDTTTELAVRRELFSRGLRYRVDFPPVPGLRRRADIAFTRLRVAIFIDGCFWHGCPIHATSPKSNRDYWAPRLAANAARDRDTNQQLHGAGWSVLRFWENEDPGDVSSEIERVTKEEQHAEER